MKLSNFPYLIQKEILDHLSINQIFFLSLCSKNTKNFIKETQKYQLKIVERVTYCINGLMKIDVKMAHKSYGSSLMYLFKSPKDFQYMGNVSVQEVRVNELAIPIDFLRYSTSDSDLAATYSPDTVELIIESIHNHLYDLFGNDTKSWMQSFVHAFAEEAVFLRNIQRVDVLQKSFDPTKIDEFLDRSTCLEHFSWSTTGQQPIKLREDSKLYDLDTVYVSTKGFCACPMAKDVLKRFNGRHAFLHSGNITTTDVIQFLNGWKLIKKFKNLELISVEWTLWRFNLQEIRNSVDIKEVDREVKYSFITKFEEKVRRFPHLESGEFKSRLYMVRESDGHVASVLLTEELIMMGVWNMTEKEFLIKFNQPIEDVMFS